MAFARFALAAMIMLIGAASPVITEPAMATTGAATVDVDMTTTDDVVTIANQGGALEGHTPTAFAGMGTGLFAGDNLNRSFPDGVGVQTYLTFALPRELDASSALLVSDALRISGTPFEDLGPLLAEPVAYESFGPEIFDLAAIGPPAECSVVEGASIECDVTEAVRVATAEAQAVAQFRVRFERAADNDGQQDLAMFFRTDSNTNAAGIFELLIRQGPAPSPTPTAAP